MPQIIQSISAGISNNQRNGPDYYDNIDVKLVNGLQSGKLFKVETIRSYEYHAVANQTSHEEGSWQYLDGYGTPESYASSNGLTFSFPDVWIGDKWDGLKPIKVEVEGWIGDANGIRFTDTEYFYNNQSHDSPYIFTPPNTTQTAAEPDAPRAKDFDVPTPFQEDSVVTGLSFGTIYSELVHQNDYDPHGDYPGYTFTAQDFEAFEVSIDGGAPISTQEAGVFVDDNGEITIDTNASPYQKFEEGDTTDVNVWFRVTDNNGNSDTGTVNFDIEGIDENDVTVVPVSDLEGGIKPAQRLDNESAKGGDFLKLGYALKGDDQTGNPGGYAPISGVDYDGLSNVAVLGPNTSSSNSYTLEISAESLNADWDLESTDITLEYNTALFGLITESDITIANELPVNNSVVVDDTNGLIRFAASSLSDLGVGSSVDGNTIIASIKLDFEDSYFKSDSSNPDKNGVFSIGADNNPLGFKLSANSDETVFSRTFTSDADGKADDVGGFTNREIKSLGDLDGKITFDENRVNLYQAEIKFEEQDGGLTFGTQRVIGANRGFTNLIRTGDTVTAETTIKNIGNSLAKDILIEKTEHFSNANFVTSRFLEKTSGGIKESVEDGEAVDLSGGVFLDTFAYDAGGQESLSIEVDMHVTGQAGSVIDVTDGLFKVSAEGMTQNPDTDATPDFFVNSAGSKNLITFQGDLNYDGRVSMKDLAFLNAGAARQELVDRTDVNGNVMTDEYGNTMQVASDDSYARDVDADFSGKIDLADLAILDQDWGRSLHNGLENFHGSGAELDWSNLAEQKDENEEVVHTWDNSSFENQNLIETDSGYVGSLEAQDDSWIPSPEADTGAK